MTLSLQVREDSNYFKWLISDRQIARGAHKPLQKPSSRGELFTHPAALFKSRTSLTKSPSVATSHHQLLQDALAHAPRPHHSHQRRRHRQRAPSNPVLRPRHLQFQHRLQTPHAKQMSRIRERQGSGVQSGWQGCHPAAEACLVVSTYGIRGIF